MPMPPRVRIDISRNVPPVSAPPTSTSARLASGITSPTVIAAMMAGYVTTFGTRYASRSVPVQITSTAAYAATMATCSGSASYR